MTQETELRLAALRSLKEWSTWLVGLETVLVGFLVSLLSSQQLALGSPYLRGAIICFGFSIISATVLLAAVPSLTERLPAATDGVQRMPLVDVRLLRRVTVGRTSAIQHLLFLAGLIGLLASVLGRQIG